MTALRINPDRLNRRLAELAQIGGRSDGGVCRLAFSDEDRAGRDYVEARMRALGLDVYIDPIGTILGIRAGQQDGPFVLTGSHIDTVATGGRFDGSLGVLAGLEVIETLKEAGITTQLPLGVAAFVNEEGVRFMPDMMGSLFLRGDLSAEAVRAITGTDQTTIGDNLDRTGMAGTDDLRRFDLHSFVELHIEQGPALEAEGVAIGIVEGVQGISWTELTIRGQANHAGTTPMALRHDAGYVAGAVAHGVRRITQAIDGQRGTVGTITLDPNLVNVIAAEATVTVDLRNADDKALKEAEARLEHLADDLEAAEGVTVQRQRLARVAPVRFAAEVVAVVEGAAADLGYASRRLISGAGHDAQIIAALCPTAMIFVPSRDGVSHNVTEYTAPEHVEAGVNVLLHTLLRRAG